MVQCGAVWCSVLQCVAVCCSVVQCVAEWCSVLQCVAVCCSGSTRVTSQMQNGSGLTYVQLLYNCSCLRSVRLAAWRRYDAMTAPADSSQAADEELAEPSLVRTSAVDQVPCHLLRDMTCVAVCCCVLRRNARLLLQHTAKHGTRQHTATHGNTRQRAATHGNTRQHTATHCNALQRTATHCTSFTRTSSVTFGECKGC